MMCRPVGLNAMLAPGASDTDDRAAHLRLAADFARLVQHRHAGDGGIRRGQLRRVRADVLHRQIDGRNVGPRRRLAYPGARHDQIAFSGSAMPGATMAAIIRSASRSGIRIEPVMLSLCQPRRSFRVFDQHIAERVDGRLTRARLAPDGADLPMRGRTHQRPDHDSARVPVGAAAGEFRHQRHSLHLPPPSGAGFQGWWPENPGARAPKSGCTPPMPGRAGNGPLPAAADSHPPGPRCAPWPASPADDARAVPR